MLTVAYCRVSTEEQAEEGFSIEGQTDKLRAYAQLRDLGEVHVIVDPGVSGKNLKRAGLQQLLAIVEAEHAAHVLIWRLDRLSRSLGDLIDLADTFDAHGVTLHSVTENLDLSTAAGRMFFHILGTFAQYFREQLSENVTMGMERAAKEGRFTSRPKTGYELVQGELKPNADAPRVREVFRLRSQSMSYRAIEDRTGFTYSTVKSILDSRVYLGEIPRNGAWLPGVHEAIVTEEEWNAAHRRLAKGVQPARDVLTGRVRCGLCQRRMAIAQNGKGSTFYSCRHRGEGCDQPVRSTGGLARAFLLTTRLLGRDEGLQAAIRRRLAGETRAAPVGARRDHRAPPADALATLSAQRRKLLELYYNDKISADGFKEEEDRLAAGIEAARRSASVESAEKQEQSDLERRFEEVAEHLRDVDFEIVWQFATVQERKILVEELLEWVEVFPDHVEVTVAGAPTLNVLYPEVGLKGSEIVCVGGPTSTISCWKIGVWSSGGAKARPVLGRSIRCRQVSELLPWLTQ